MERLHIKFDGDSGFRTRLAKVKTPWYSRAYWAVWHNFTDLVIIAACAVAVWSFV